MSGAQGALCLCLQLARAHFPLPLDLTSPFTKPEFSFHPFSVVCVALRGGGQIAIGYGEPCSVASDSGQGVRPGTPEAGAEGIPRREIGA